MRGVDMDRLREFLKLVHERGLAEGNFLGLLHVLIGRRIALPDGTPVSAGLTWRELAALLKKVRWDRESVRELGLDPARLPPRDRQRYWHTAITQAGVNSAAAMAAGEKLREAVQGLGYTVSPPPGTGAKAAEEKDEG
jgi:hypothetical protein